jgi:hypothetical protein
MLTKKRKLTKKSYLKSQDLHLNAKDLLSLFSFLLWKFNFEFITRGEGKKRVIKIAVYATKNRARFFPPVWRSQRYLAASSQIK